MSKKVDYKAQLQRIYFWSMGAYASLIILTAVLMGKTSYQLTLGHLAKDDLASRSSAVLVPGAHAIFDLQIRWAVISMLLISLVVPFIYTKRLPKLFQKGIKNRVMPLRWIDLALTSAVMVQTISILSGLQDIMTLKLVAGLMIITCGFGWLAERHANEAKKLVKPTFFAGIFTGSLPWLMIAGYAIATPFYSAVRAPWHIYALYATSLVTFTMLALNQWRQHQKQKAWKDYVFVERNYALISLVSKIAFAVILIVGLRK